MSMKPTSQYPEIASACSIIKSAHGEVFLQMMRDLYFHRSVSSSDGISDVLAAAREIGLVIADSTGAPKLTASGYLVGNVAKEYCNYLDHNRVMPDPKPAEDLFHGKDVLDLGCSFGRWLWWFQRSAKSAKGIEMQPEYIMLGQALSEREQLPIPEMICASAEDMDSDVADDSLDLIFCRLVLNHVRILHTLKKATNALRRGGILWIQVESIQQPMKKLVRYNGRFRDNGFAAFSLFNSALCMSTGMQVSVPMAGRMHSVHKPAFPCLWWWKRAFSSVGLLFIEQTGESASGFSLSGRKES
jgi:2-polyprenyl-3-methyl-5-hydroxy-6-metoxy-1,4-benzoquinol methylase